MSDKAGFLSSHLEAAARGMSVVKGGQSSHWHFPKRVSLVR